MPEESSSTRVLCLPASHRQGAVEALGRRLGVDRAVVAVGSLSSVVEIPSLTPFGLLALALALGAAALRRLRSNRQEPRY